VLRIKGLRTITIDRRLIDRELIGAIDGIGLRVGGRFGVAHTFFPGGSYLSHIFVQAWKRYATERVRSCFGEEEKFGSITRSAKLYSTTRAVLRR
jgi:hypothetical protein